MRGVSRSDSWRTATNSLSKVTAPRRPFLLKAARARRRGIREEGASGAAPPCALPPPSRRRRSRRRPDACALGAVRVLPRAPRPAPRAPRPKTVKATAPRTASASLHRATAAVQAAPRGMQSSLLCRQIPRTGARLLGLLAGRQAAEISKSVGHPARGRRVLFSDLQTDVPARPDKADAHPAAYMPLQAPSAAGAGDLFGLCQG